jgi:hypothetical protein
LVIIYGITTVFEELEVAIVEFDGSKCSVSKTAFATIKHHN